jgi:hypothetical protein
VLGPERPLAVLARDPLSSVTAPIPTLPSVGAGRAHSVDVVVAGDDSDPAAADRVGGLDVEWRVLDDVALRVGHAAAEHRVPWATAWRTMPARSSPVLAYAPT